MVSSAVGRSLEQRDLTSDLSHPTSDAKTRERLQRGRVLVVGLGGLGAPAALTLANAGVGTIGLADGDKVELSNLQRQIIHETASVGMPKVESAAEFLRRRAPGVSTRQYFEALTFERCLELFEDYDFVIDGTDDVTAKFAINDAAVRKRTAYSHAGAVGWVGQLFTVAPGRSACLRCLFPVPPEDEDPPTCQTAGIVGAVVGAIGVAQALEALKSLTGIGDLLLDRMLTYDALAQRWRTVPFHPAPSCTLCAAVRGDIARSSPDPS